MKVDLHTHSTFSDGNLTPTKLVQMAIESNIPVLSITDHDSVGAYGVLKNIVPKELKLITGTELSSEYSGKDVHILLYGFDPNHKLLNEYLNFFKSEREKRAYKMLQKVRDHGYDVSDDELRASVPGEASLARPHIAKLLISKGWFTSVAQVFDGFLNEGGLFYVPKYKAPPEEIIYLAQKAEAKCVLAHPILLNSEDIVAQLLKLPFDGLEVYHPKQSKNIKHYLNIAKTHQLLVTGGSDFHAIAGRYPEHLSEYTVQGEDIREFLDTIPYFS